jgi:hypothetical protein
MFFSIGVEVLTAVDLNVAMYSVSELTCCTLVSCAAEFLTLKMEVIHSPKRRFVYGLHGAISKNMATFMFFSVS